MPLGFPRVGSLLTVISSLILAKVIIDLTHYSRRVVQWENETKLSTDLAGFRSFKAVEHPPSSCAYAFVIGGCNSDNALCDGFIYNILVATQILREEGSTQDVVAFFQMSINSTSTRLAPRVERRFQEMGIKLRYVPPSPLESFFETVINKFRILKLVEYQRVLLMDGDVMPLGNLDYLFDFSLRGILKENVVVAGALEPANGGFFMLQPGDYESLQEIIYRREELSLNSAAEYKGYKFDVGLGWGHKIQPPDQWVARRPSERGTNWTFHFAFSDQGLLYHWVKYYKRSVSIIFADKVENWANSSTGEVRLERVLHKPFINNSKPRIHFENACRKFMCDFMHFAGSKKPWLRRPPKNLSNAMMNTDPYYIWWYTLSNVNRKLKMDLDFANWRVWQQPPLGGYATLADMEKHARAMIKARKATIDLINS